MAIVYSLICFGGKDGKSVTCSNSGGYLLLTATKNGIRNGLKVYFSGTLPGNIASTSTPYYLRGETIDTATVYDTQAHAIAGGTTGKVAWSSAGSGVKITSGYWYELPAGSGSTGRARYGTAGSERCYDGILACRNARYSAAVATNVEVVEFATQFFDCQVTSAVALNIPAAQVIWAGTVDDAPTDAAHGGVIAQCTHNGASLWLPNGYICDQTTYYVAGAIDLSGARNEIRDLSFATAQTYSTAINCGESGLYNIVERCVVLGYGSAVTARLGIHLRQDTIKVVNNLFYGFSGTNSMGVQVYGYDRGNGSIVACNTSVLNGVGFGSANTGTSPKGWFYNNIALGNTTNWGTSGTGSMHGVGYNAGLSGEAWGTTGRVTMATTDFADYANYDFTPALSSSPQVDTGTTVIGMTAEDIIGNTRPNYNAGTTEVWDIGADEFDHGLTPPATRSLDLTLSPSGCDVKVFTTTTQTVLDSNASASTSYSYDPAVDGVTVDFTVQKAGYLQQRFTGIALTATSNPYTVTLEIDQNYVASSGLTWGSNATVDATNKFVKSSASTSGRNLYSWMVEMFIAQSSLDNVAFPAIMNGPGGLILKDGWETRGYSTAGSGYDWSTSTSTLYNITDDGLTYQDTSGTATATFASITTQGVPAGEQARFQQSDGGTTVDARSTGDVNQLVQVYGDASHGSVSATTWMVWKCQAEGYDQSEFDLYSTFGTLEGQGYIVPLTPIPNGVATGDPALTITVTDHAGSPVTWNGKDFSITITDAASPSSGTNILKELRYNIAAGGTYQGKDGFDWHDLVRTNGDNFKTVRGAVYGDTGAALKGVRVVKNDGSTPHADFDLFTADDGTTYAPPVTSNITITGLVDAASAYDRLQIINSTAEAASAWQASTAYSLGDIVLRTTGIGTESTAGLYMRCTTAGTSNDTEPTWDTTVGNTTADTNGTGAGDVVWTTYAVLFYDADPASTGYSGSYTDGNEFLTGEAYEVRFSEMNAGTTFKTWSTTGIVSSTGFTLAANPGADETFATNALDGSAYESTFSPDYGTNYLILDTNTDFSGLAAYAYFCYTLTTSQGMYFWWGGVTALDTGNYRINSDILDVYFDESGGFVKQTDSSRWFRKDGTRPAIDPTTGGYGIEINWRVPVNVVSTGGSALTAEESAKLLSLPTAAATATQVLSSAATTPIAANVKKVNGTAVKGDGTAGDKFRSTLVA